MKKWLKISLISLSLISTAAISATSTALIYNNSIKKKQNELSKITLLDKGNTISYSKDKKINYVAFGDSVSAGFSPYINDLSLSRTTLLNIRDNDNKGSFNNYLKQALINKDLLNSYKDFSQSGLSSYEINNLSYEKVQAIKKADYISYQAGANDLLNNLIDSKVYSDQESIDKDYKTFIDIKNKKITDQNQIKEYLDSFLSIKKELNKNDLIAIKESIGINILNFIKTTYDLNNNTSILLLGYHFPYQRWNSYFYNKEVLDTKISFIEFFKEINNSIKQIADKYNFVNYLDINEVVQENKDNIDQILPNHYDIHFSSYFSIILANKIWTEVIDKIYKENNLSDFKLDKTNLNIKEFSKPEEINTIYKSYNDKVWDINKNSYISSFGNKIVDEIDVAKSNREKFKEIVTYNWEDIL